MWIESLEVEGGVLDGFHQEFAPGLNVLIGGRGTGKSSVIELLRFCLNARPYVQTQQKNSNNHALGVLGDGRVTTTFNDNGERIVVSRTTFDDLNEDVAAYAPFVFSQSEIEAIGLQASSRLRLIDDFLPVPIANTFLVNLTSKVHSVSVEIRSLISEIDDLRERLSGLSVLELELATVRAERDQQSLDNDETERLRKLLEELNPHLAAAHVRNEVLGRADERYQGWLSRATTILEIKPELEQWSTFAGAADELHDLRIKEDVGFNLVSQGFDALREVGDNLHRRAVLAREQLQGLENSARELRLKIEAQQAGASALDKKISELTQSVSVLKSLEELVASRQARLRELSRQRDALSTEIELNRQNVIMEREVVVARLNDLLSPTIRLTLEPYAQQREYFSALVSGLRGSGLRYNDLAEKLASMFSPRELALLVEDRNASAIAEALKISDERAYRVCDALISNDGAGLFTVNVDDDLKVELLDGVDFKPISALSTGQRCTAVLPIILSHDERPIILDQPEDHLDNAFVVGTLVKSISTRKPGAQTIIATHNPNIPVLGDASRVIHMDSNGSRCFVRSADTLFAPRIVEAISSIMEGGRDAFARRASFYRAPNDIFS